MSKRYDLIGARFGNLTVIEKSAIRKAGAIQWRCRCACGVECLRMTHILNAGRTTSCGCEASSAPGKKNPKWRGGYTKWGSRAWAQTRWYRYRGKRTFSPEDLFELCRDWDGHCAICNCQPTGAARHIDHDHQTGKLRGILCANGNLMLGNAKDKARSLRRGADYLEACR